MLALALQATNYDIVADDKTLVMPCSKAEDKSNMAISDFLDVSNLQLVLDKDFETLYISLDAAFKVQLPKAPIQMQVDVLRWERGQWVPTVIALKRDDVCKSLADPFEIWHPYIVTHIPKAQRVCPPKQGHVYRLRNITNRMELKSFPRWDIEGDLKAVLHFTVGHMKACALVFVTVAIV
ncbi:hypothetical protein KR093_008541 [Drosophila rubida]|uniref:Uncharacterized protein n=1 Tax=Drosophila rubida TaxID=30044 RepID=A0AAD4PS86_9MUSC|nr:hypothetical protein KR093_008541 [Drosophila rubida]